MRTGDDSYMRPALTGPIWGATSICVAMVAALALPAVAFGAGAQAEQAYQHLSGDLDAHIGEADYNYLLGMAAIDAGHVPEAILAFQRTIALDPAHSRARAEMARAYAMAGDPDTARAQFADVLRDAALPDPVRARVTGLVAGLDKQISGKTSDVSGFGELSGGYDSNLNSATDLTSITIPLFAVFGPGTLAGNARSQNDGYGEAQAGLSAVTGLDRGNKLFGSVLGSYRGYGKARAFNQGSVTGSFGFAHSTPNHDTLSLSAQVQQFWLGDQSYRQTYGAIAQYTHALQGGRALSFSAQYARLRYDNQPLYNAHHIAAGISYATRRFVLSGDGGYEAVASGSTQSNYFADASASVDLPLAKRVSLLGGAALGVRRYDKLDALFLTKRHDTRVDVSAGFKYALNDRLSLRPRVTYTRNFSNIPLYDYERFTAGLAARVEF